ncbi:MAG: DUF1292 domain-containing protein [Clostridia bacterium]|nr:DUF1292 domain-containing protein [Clostridia bacterium]
MEDFRDLVTVIDDNGIEHIFEELDRIETEDGKKYIALVSADEDESEDSGELSILRVIDDSGDTVLEPIEDEEEFDDIANAFQERLSEYFQFDEEE